MTMKHKCPGQFDGKPCVVHYAPHRRGMCALAGVEELRAAVRWADNTRESQHENLTAEQILARFRTERDS